MKTDFIVKGFQTHQLLSQARYLHDPAAKRYKGKERCCQCHGVWDVKRVSLMRCCILFFPFFGLVMHSLVSLFSEVRLVNGSA